MDNKQALNILQNIDLTEIAEAIAVTIQVLEGNIVDEQIDLPALDESKMIGREIAFAEWILREGFEKYEDKGRCWWGKFNEEKDYSTKELFELWQDIDSQQFPDKARDNNAKLMWEKGAPDMSGAYLIITRLMGAIELYDQYDPDDEYWDIDEVLWYIGPFPLAP